MPWIGSVSGRAICDGCYAASQAENFTGKRDLKVIGAYVPKGNGSEVIYCPRCIMTNTKAYGGLIAHSMTWDKANKLFERHWHTPEEALALGYTEGMVQVAAPPEPPEPPPGQRVAALTPAFAIEDVSCLDEQSPLAAVVVELKAEVDMLKMHVYELKEELKRVKSGVARDDELKTLQNEVRALKDQVSRQPSQPSSVLARRADAAFAIQDVSGRVEQTPLAVLFQDLKAEVNTLKAQVYKFREELKQVKTRVGCNDDIETLQNEVRTLLEQVSEPPSQSSSFPESIVHLPR